MGAGIDRVWKLHGDGRTVEPGAVVRPDERLNTPRMLGLGGQHVLAMFGATALMPGQISARTPAASSSRPSSRLIHQRGRS